MCIQARNDLCISDIVCMQDWYHMIRNVQFLNTNYSSVIYDAQLKDDFRCSLRHCFTYCVQICNERNLWLRSYLEENVAAPV
jgi:hypothetical protein